MMSTRHATMLAGLVLSVVTGCAQPSGPVLGEWRGQESFNSFVNPAQLDIVLNGEPGSQTGSYHLTSLNSDPTSKVGHEQIEWGGTWVRSQSAQDGQVLTIITLQDMLPYIIGNYALLADNTLHALDPHGHVDMTPAGALYTLRPVPPRNAG